MVGLFGNEPPNRLLRDIQNGIKRGSAEARTISPAYSLRLGNFLHGACTCGMIAALRKYLTYKSYTRILFHCVSSQCSATIVAIGSKLAISLGLQCVRREAFESLIGNLSAISCLPSNSIPKDRRETKMIPARVPYKNESGRR